MTEKLIIKVKSLKDLLKLFDPEESLSELSLGDTWHPSSGFVDESILSGKTIIKDVLAFDYEFVGLVGFEACIGSLSIKLTNSITESDLFQYYLAIGPVKEVSILKNKATELNAYNPDTYVLEVQTK